MFQNLMTLVLVSGLLIVLYSAALLVAGHLRPRIDMYFDLAFRTTTDKEAKRYITLKRPIRKPRSLLDVEALVKIANRCKYQLVSEEECRKALLVDWTLREFAVTGLVYGGQEGKRPIAVKRRSDGSLVPCNPHEAEYFALCRAS